MTDQVLPGAPAGDIAPGREASSRAVKQQAASATAATEAAASVTASTNETSTAVSPEIHPVVPGAGPSIGAAGSSERADEPPAAGGVHIISRRPGPLRFVLGFAFGLLAVFALAAGGLYAFEQQFSGRILPGVHVGDVDVSGLTTTQATAALADAYATLGEGALVLTGAGLSISVPLADLRRPDVELMAQGAMAVGREGSPFDRMVINAKTAARGVVLEPQVIVDDVAVERAVSQFASSIDRAPADARIERGADGFRLVDGTAGRATDWQRLLAAAVDVLGDIDLPSEVVLEADVVLVPPVVTSEEAAAALQQANLMAADIVIADTGKSWTLPADQVRSWITFGPTGAGTYQAAAKPAGLDAKLAEIASAIQRAPANASYLFDRKGNVVGSTEGREGRSLDTPATLAAIESLLLQRGGGQVVPSLAPVVSIVKPDITTEQAAATAPLMKKVSEWTTYFPISDRNGFGANIWIPAMDIDGYVIAAGATFDFWRAIGPVTRERGYRDGGAIINGKTEPQGALAGGICSTSTTLFNAAMRAGLQMMARRNHYYYITRYPKGLDATVFQSSSGSVQTMSFRNDTGSPILIRAYKIREGSAGYVKFELFGVPTGRTVGIGSEVVKNVRRATDRVEYTDTKPAGYRERLESPADGMDVWRTVTVRNPDGSVLRSTTYYSHYARVDGLTIIGTGGTTAETTPPPT